MQNNSISFIGLEVFINLNMHLATSTIMCDNADKSTTMYQPKMQIFACKPSNHQVHKTVAT